MLKHYVTYYFGGRFFLEEETREVLQCDIEAAAKMSREPFEHYQHPPMYFRFSTYEEHEPIVKDGLEFRTEPKKIAESGRFFLSGEILTYDQLLLRDREDEEILVSNIRFNQAWVVIRTPNGAFQEFGPNDALVVDGEVVRRGDDQDLVDYRRVCSACSF